jgi:50S ribosomal subunit-associated GTPase HflX
VALCFDMGDRRSFEHVRDWHRQVTAQLPEGTVPMILVGNKVDLEEVGKIAVSREEAAKVAAEMGIPCFFTSALKGTGVNEAFEELGTTAARRVFASRAPAAGATPGAASGTGAATNPAIVNLREPADEATAKANGCQC